MGKKRRHYTTGKAWTSGEEFQFMLRDKYNMSFDQYMRMFKKQKGKCLICGGHNKKGATLYVDHNHKTDKVRGLLCRLCNFMLGFAKDNPDILRKCTAYLDKNKDCKKK